MVKNEVEDYYVKFIGTNFRAIKKKSLGLE